MQEIDYTEQNNFYIKKESILLDSFFIQLLFCKFIYKRAFNKIYFYLIIYKITMVIEIEC